MGRLWEGVSSLITYAGYPGKFAVESVEGTAQLQITILQAHAQAVPVVRLCSSNSVWYEQGDLLSQLFESIRIAPDRAQPPKTRISVADLAGQWREGGSDNTGWVDAHGTYAGTSLVAHGITYEIAAGRHVLLALCGAGEWTGCSASRPPVRSASVTDGLWSATRAIM